VAAKLMPRSAFCLLRRGLMSIDPRNSTDVAIGADDRRGATMAKHIAGELAEKRVALVIGIERYRAARKLTNPVRDARMVAAALDPLGFTVVVASDVTQRRLAATLDRFEGIHRGADVALLFFAGHGVQIAGRNFLLPTDAEITSAAALEASSLSLDGIFARIAATAPRRIMLLDACRNDPFGTASDAAASDAGRGLKVREGAPGPVVVPGLGRMGRADGTIYVFATAPGTTASDGVGEHSPFTQALLTSLGRQGLDFSIVMKMVQQDVYLRTAGHQVPYIEDALPDPPVFADVSGAAFSEREQFLVRISKIGPDTRSQVERIAAANGIALAPLYAALLAAEADGMLDYPAREKHLERAAEEFIKARTELKALASADPEVSRLRDAAEYDLSLGHFEAAQAALTRAIEVDRGSAERIEARLKERRLSPPRALRRAPVSRGRGSITWRLPQTMRQRLNWFSPSTASWPGATRVAAPTTCAIAARSLATARLW
jgi:uncharacterized caspase-like protein